MSDPCPSPGVLEAVALGMEAPSAVLRHVADCSACREQVDEIRTNQEFLRQAGGALRRAARAKQQADPASTQSAAPAIPGFELLEEISRGGQGVVYRARQSATKRLAAVKMLLGGDLASPRQRARFEREIEIAARLRHPNIVSIFESGATAGGYPYVAMEFLAGVPIDVFVRERLDQLPERERTQRIVGLISQVASAVGHAHSNGVIHRDIKPSNIFVDHNGVPRVLDFGLAREIEGGSDVTLTREFAGTPAYAAPEQFAGDSGAIDARTDVYSLGVLLYALLCRKHPYPTSGSLASLIGHARSTEPPPPSRIVPRLPADIEVITLKALSKESARRYANAAALAGDLEDYLAGRPISARRDSTLYVLRRLARKHRVPVAAAAIALCVVLAALVGLTWQARRLDFQRQLAEEALAESDLHRARLIGKTGDTVQAERWLWKAARMAGVQVGAEVGLEPTPAARRASWALLELYSIIPRQFLAQSLPWPAKIGFNSAGDEIWVVSRTAATERWTLDGRRLSETPRLVENPELRGLSACADGSHAVLLVGDRLCMIDVLRGHVDSYVPNPPVPVNYAAINESGNAIVVGCADGDVLIVDWESKTKLARIHGPFTGGCSWNEDLLWLTLVREGVIWQAGFRPPYEQPEYSLPLGPTRAESPNQAFASLSPDNRYIAVTLHGSLLLFDAHSRKLIGEQVANAPFTNSPRFVNNGQTFLTISNDGIVAAWRVPDLTQVRSYRGMRSGPWVVSGALAAICDDAGTLALWRTEDAPWPTRVPATPKTTHSLALSDDGKFAAAGDETGRLTVFRTQDNSAVAQLPAHTDLISAVDFFPDGDRLLTFGMEGAVREWRRSGALVRAHAVGRGCLRFGEISPDGEWIAAGGQNGEVYLWNGHDDAVRKLESHRRRVPQLAFSPDSRQLASISERGEVLARDIAAGGKTEWRVQLPVGAQGVRAVAYSPDGRTLAIGSDDRVIRFLDPRTGKVLRELRGLPWGVFDIEYHRSGKVLFACGRGNEFVAVDPESCTELATFSGHNRLIFALKLDPTGRFVYTAGEDDWIGVWDLDELRGRVRGNTAFNLTQLDAEPAEK
ncbi:MAG: serine/threonine protein kinase [Planctomycetes bacterium]|nr:serine/threonine protein kinase [Planctomycetota bacterium]